MKKAFIAILLSISFTLAAAQEPEYQPYFVSAILKLNGAEATLKIVQGMVISDSTNNAQMVFTVIATKQFPQYTVIDVLPSTFTQLYKSLPTQQQSPSSKGGAKEIPL